MIIQLTKNEFQQVRAFIIGVRNPKLTTEFNDIFNKANCGGNSFGMTGTVIPPANDVVITMPEATAMKLLKVFAKHSRDLGTIVNSPTINIMDAPYMLNVAQAFFQDLIGSFT